jgi:hypothetical protein
MPFDAETISTLLVGADEKDVGLAAGHDAGSRARNSALDIRRPTQARPDWNVRLFDLPAINFFRGSERCDVSYAAQMIAGQVEVLLKELKFPSLFNAAD